MNQIALLDSTEDSTENPVEDSAAVEPLVRLWLLRLLVPLEGASYGWIVGHRCIVHNWDVDDFKSFAYFAKIFDTGNEWYKKPHSREDPLPRMALACLRKLHKEAEKTSRNVKAPGVLTGRIAHLARLVGLSATDCRILEFAVLLHCDELLQ